MKGAALAASILFAGTALAMDQTAPMERSPEGSQAARQGALGPAMDLSALTGWANDDHGAALSAFLRFCNRASRPAGRTTGQVDPAAYEAICTQAARAPDARTFFEQHFSAHRVNTNGFLTGYYEPEIQASRTRTPEFTVPLHRKPQGLIALTRETRPADWPDTLTHGRKTRQTISQMPDRGAIMDGALDEEGLELVWLQDPVEAFFVHIQGSARLKLTDGTLMRVGYAGKTGHPYTGIGRLLVERGEGRPEDFDMDGLKHWLRADPVRRDALLRENRSYIFFDEVTTASPDDGPIGAAGLPLVAGRSLAVDNAVWPYGSLVFVAADLPDPQTPSRPFSRLMVADDTGSAIKGPARGDLFAGSGDEAGRIAGPISHPASFTVLVPKFRPSD